MAKVGKKISEADENKIFIRSNRIIKEDGGDDFVANVRSINRLKSGKKKIKNKKVRN